MGNSGRSSLFVGSYTVSLPHVAARGEGVTLLELDHASGRLSRVSVLNDVRNPSYLALGRGGRWIYAVEELSEAEGASVVTIMVDRQTGRMQTVSRMGALGDYPCHLTVSGDGRQVFLANYASGSVVSYATDEKGLPKGPGQILRREGSGPDRYRQTGPHAHQVLTSPDGNSIIVCDLGTDEIGIYPLADGRIGTSASDTVRLVPGSLPRHAVQSEDGEHIFVVTEASSTMVTCIKTSSGFVRANEISTLPPDCSAVSACSAVRLHPGGRYLYAANRGHDTIAAFSVGSNGALSRIGWFDTRGAIPRDFAIDPSGRFMAVANQDGHSLSVHEIDGQDGSLRPIGETFPIGSPACVMWA
ncbi:lactonase family protein [Paracoccus sp. MBLB3053]|uniref:Lactonase family protein n=1 Tax=Paracoccus aurantius TaxID=3073814 RepID=A0ABU2HWB4_9RHOB|nr:lactonase family protein [Paracoccus sp. MBLB3053]MDS9469349.1 lactonase family protein [Paracoccus sp. MBLB3053]